MVDIQTRTVHIYPGYSLLLEYDLDVPEQYDAWDRCTEGPLSYNLLIDFKVDPTRHYTERDFDDEGFLKYPIWDVPHIYASDEDTVRDIEDVLETCVRCFTYTYGPLCEKHRKEIIDGVVRE